MNTSTENNFSKLKQLFNTEILLLNHRGFIKNIENVIKTIADQPKDKSITLLIKTTNEQHALLKLWLFLYTSLQYRYLKFRISKIPEATIKSYGVYPQAEDPFAIYQLGTTAEEYTTSYILPANDKNLKGLITRVISFVTRYHASTAGIVILVHKKS